MSERLDVSKQAAAVVKPEIFKFGVILFQLLLLVSSLHSSAGTSSVITPMVNVRKEIRNSRLRVTLPSLACSSTPQQERKFNTLCVSPPISKNSYFFS